MDCPIVEVCLLFATVPLVGNVGHVGGFPLTLEGTDTIGTEGFPPATASTG